MNPLKKMQQSYFFTLLFLLAVNVALWLWIWPEPYCQTAVDSVYANPDAIDGNWQHMVSYTVKDRWGYRYVCFLEKRGEPSKLKCVWVENNQGAVVKIGPSTFIVTPTTPGEFSKDVLNWEPWLLRFKEVRAGDEKPLPGD